MKHSRPCANCATPHPFNDDENDVCLLAALLVVVGQRDDYEDADLQTVSIEADTNSLWDQLGPVVDWLGDQVQCAQVKRLEDGPSERQIEAMMDAPSWAEREEMEARRRP